MNNESPVSKDSEIISKEPIGISTAVCTHIPSEPFHHVGQVTKCKLCACNLVYNNPPPGSKHRISKKERRKIKAIRKSAEEANVRR